MDSHAHFEAFVIPTREQNALLTKQAHLMCPRADSKLRKRHTPTLCNPLLGSAC